MTNRDEIAARLAERRQAQPNLGKGKLRTPLLDDAAWLMERADALADGIAGMFPIAKHDWDVGEDRCPHCAAAKAALAAYRGTR